jgi:O-antigen/teichoic acid export membrane protein
MKRGPAPDGPVPAHDDSRAHLLGKVLGTLIGRAGILLFSFLFAIAVARSLSPEGRGQFALLQTLNGLTYVFANFAISLAIIRQVGKRLLSARDAASQAPGLAILCAAVGIAVVLPIALALRSTVLAALPASLVVAAVVLATPLLIRDYLGGALISIGRSYAIVLVSILQPAGALAALLGIAIIWDQNVVTVLVAWAVGLCSSATIALVLAYRILGGGPRLPRKAALSLVRFGVRTYPVFLSRFLNLRVDQLLVASLASATALGYYAVAVSVGELLLQIPVVMLWALAGEISGSNREQSAMSVVRFCRWSIIILLASGLSIAVLAPVGLPWAFGEDYRPAVASVLLLLPGMVVYAPAIIIGEYFILQRGQPSKATLAALTSLVLGIALNFPLTSSLGALGASIASSISYCAMFLVAVFLFRQDSGQSGLRMFHITARDLKDMVTAFRHLRTGRISPTVPENI